MKIQSIFEILGKIAGLAGICIGLILIIFREVIRRNIFSNFTKEQSYKIIRLIIVLTFLISLIGLIFWFAPQIFGPLKKVKVVSDSDTLGIEVNTNPEGLIIVFGSEKDSFKMVDVFYDDKKEAFDIKVQNNSKKTIFITKIRLLIFYNSNVGAIVGPSGTEQFDVDKQDVNSKKEYNETFSYDKIHRVSYKVLPNDVDRYLIEFKLDKSKLYNPKTEYGGGYNVVFTFFYDNNKMLNFSGIIRDGKYDFTSQ